MVLPELTIMEDFLPFELGRVDVILGMIWLCKMGYMEVNWPTLTMTFKSGEKKVTKGDASLTAAEVTLKTLTQSWEDEDMGFVVEVHHLELEAVEAEHEKSLEGIQQEPPISTGI